MLAVSFYDQVLLELLAAVGAALFLGNLLALVRRRREREAAGAAAESNLERAPLARTVTYLLIGLVVMLWGIGSLVT